MNWLRKLLRDWLLADLEGRMKDVERHFVTKRDSSGGITETLADVPLQARKDKQIKLRGLSPLQKRAYLERTDGGRLVG